MSDKKYIQGPSQEYRQKRATGWHPLSKREEQLEALCRRLAGALEDWQQYDTESSDNHPCPDLALRAAYRNLARTTTDVALTEYKNLLGD